MMAAVRDDVLLVLVCALTCSIAQDESSAYSYSSEEEEEEEEGEAC